MEGSPLRVLAYVLVAVAIVLTLAAVMAFRKHATTIIPHQTPSNLITTGIFARTRNPIYLADALILAAAVIYFGAWLSVLLVFAFVWWINVHFIQPEEARMREKFGETFLAYERNVRRWA